MVSNGNKDRTDANENPIYLSLFWKPAILNFQYCTIIHIVSMGIGMFWCIENFLFSHTRCELFI